MMLRVFICSPFRAETMNKRLANVELAWKLMDLALSEGHAPFAPHLLYPHALDDNEPESRAKGIAAGLEWLRVSDEVWLADGVEITDGMMQEIDTAKHLGRPIVLKKLEA